MTKNSPPFRHLDSAAVGDLFRQVGVAAATAITDGLAASKDDDAEAQAVYRLVAEQLADDLKFRHELILPAVIALCGTGQDADERILAAVRNWLVRLRITYASPRLGPTTRTVEMMVDPDPAGVCVRTIEQRISRDDLPSDVRQQMLREGLREITFQPYPRSN